MTIDPTREQSRIDAARQALAQAQQVYDAGVRGLLASDGKTPIAAQPEHDRRVAELRDALEKKIASVDAASDGVIAAIDAARLNPYADPVAALDLANHDLAARHRVFVAEDCASLPVPELIGRLEWAGKSSAPYVRVLYARYGLARFKRELDAQPQPAGLAELRAALEALGAIGSARGLSPELQELRFKADGLKRAAAFALAGGKPTLGAKIAF
jgi:hypothetical protein